MPRKQKRAGCVSAGYIVDSQVLRGRKIEPPQTQVPEAVAGDQILPLHQVASRDDMAVLDTVQHPLRGFGLLALCPDGQRVGPMVSAAVVLTK